MTRYIIEYYTQSRLIRYTKVFTGEIDATAYKVTLQKEGARIKIFRPLKLEL